jgi:hypothetical protein
LKRPAFTLLLTVVGASLPGAAVRATGEVTIRGAYYREASTRVIQPVVQIREDLPKGFDIQTHYLLDAITSASANAGAAADQIFTETRNEVGLGLGKNWGWTRLALNYQYSAESDYWSHAFGGLLSQRFWGDTAKLDLGLGVAFDEASSRGRTPFCASPPSRSCPLDSYFAGLSYTQVLSPYSIAQVVAETSYLSGFQGNLYRVVPGIGPELPPERRERNAVAARLAYYFPSALTGLQLYYRFYWDFFPGTPASASDPWSIRAHTIEGRVYKRMSPTLELRVLYRQHFQNKASFWCDTTVSPTCYQVIGADGMAVFPAYYSSDPKLGPVRTEYPEIQLAWEAESLSDYRFLRWFATGTFTISYGHYYQNDGFGDAHVLQMGYTMPY